MIKNFIPPLPWRFPVLILLAIFVGLFAFIFKVSNAPSYLSDDPKTCVNCHIMAPQYATWQHSSHREWANCNDCHVPHNNVLNKYFFKAKDGLRHATVFTMRAEPQVIFIKEEGAEVVHQNCIRCHEQQITDPKLDATVANFTAHTQDRKCWECHREVPHGRVNSLSSTPNARVPLPESPVPDWLKKYTEK
ncbi:cytochrome c nitrite reductase small subunit [Labilibacter sediminis]|nr:cytochrome c nitrite reductase small subunit [Labilibacter sediminis]